MTELAMLAQSGPTNPFFHGFEPIGRTLLVGVLAYVVLVVFLRLSGNRTLSKMNAFDFVVTIALGSTLSTILLNKQVSLAEGAAAFAVLVVLQYVVTWSSVRWHPVRQLVTGSPRLVLSDGRFLERAMRRARVTDEEILAAARSAGVVRQSDIRAVILETDGSFSVIPRDAESQRDDDVTDRGVGTGSGGSSD
ncbi:MAG: DUF421 domain-containing protein [Phycisphaerales bacterium JB058]